MKRQALVAALYLFLLNCPEAPARTLVLHFPPDKSYGQIVSIAAFSAPKSPDSMAMLEPHDAALAAAQGKVTINIGDNYYCSFDPNRAMYENPKALLSVSPHGIEAIKIHFISMDPKEDFLCEQFAQYLGHLSDLRLLQAKNSDLSDKALAAIKSLPLLIDLDLSGSMVTGKCFNSVARFKNLRVLGLSDLHLDGADFGLLQGLSLLHTIYLHSSHLQNSFLKGIDQCQSLEHLDLSNNAEVTDDILLRLKKLKKLSYLDLGGTAVHPLALLQLKGLPLKAVAVTRTAHLEPEVVSKLKRAFPELKIIHQKADRKRKSPLSQEEKFMFAPLK